MCLYIRCLARDNIRVQGWTNGPSDQWAVGPMGRRINGPSDQWAVGPMGRRTNGPSDQWVVRRTNGPSDQWAVGLMGRRNDAMECIFAIYCVHIMVYIICNVLYKIAMKSSGIEVPWSTAALLSNAFTVAYEIQNSKVCNVSTSNVDAK